MKKTLARKMIKGHPYYYLVYRKGGKLTSDYLGKLSSSKFKKYLLSLTASGSHFGLEKTKRENFACGVPVAYVEDGHFTLLYKSGVEEIYDGKMKVVKVVYPHG